MQIDRSLSKKYFHKAIRILPGVDLLCYGFILSQPEQTKYIYIINILKYKHEMDMHRKVILKKMFFLYFIEMQIYLHLFTWNCNAIDGKTF